MTDLSNIKTVLINEFSVSCDMIKLAIENMDETTWSVQSNSWSYVLTLYHIIDTIEFYFNDEPINLVEHGGLGIVAPDKSEEEINKLIERKNRDFFFDYLEKVRRLITEKIQSYSENQLFEKDKFSEWGFTSRFHKYSYTLRHTMMHTGELNKTLRDLDKRRIKWL